MEILKVIQGQDFPLRVYSTNSVLIMKDTVNILSFSNVTEDDNGDLWLHILIDNDNFISKGIKQYQLFENNKLKENGVLEVVPSLLVDPEQDLRGRYAVIVEAIEKQIAGVATSAQKHIQVGDKTIDRYSASELLELLTYFQGKLAEEESGTKTNPKSDQMTFLYKWTLR